MDSPTLDELLNLEHQGWAALCAGTAADFYGRKLTDDGVMILAHGFALNRQQTIDSLTEAPPWRIYEISDERLIRLNDSAAILIYRGTAWRQEMEPEFLAWMATTYIRRDAQWRIAAYQQTPIPG